MLVIIGAGGHGRICAEIAELNGYDRIVFLDDGSVDGVKIDGKTDDISKYISTADFFVGIGNNRVREKIFLKIEKEGGKIATLIHPNSTVSKTAKISAGTVVMAGAVINAGARIGRGVIINTCSSVDHDCTVSDFVHISVGAHLAGTVMIGAGTFIGAGASVINNVLITEDCTVGAAAAVVQNIDRSGTYVGVPAKRIK